ncbi:MAK10-like protein [Tanacetum coccineum]
MSSPPDVPNATDRGVIELENQVQCLMEAHLAPKPSIQVNKITSSCEICSGPHDTQYCMKNLEPAFVYYVSSRTDKAGVKSLTVNKIGTSKPKELEKALEDEFKDFYLKLPVLEVLAHAPMYSAILDKYVESLELGLADGTKSYPVGIVRNVEAHIRKLKLSEDFYVIDMEKDSTCPLLVGRGFLVTASAVIDCKKAKIAVGEGITRSIFGVKEIDLGVEDVSYWTNLGKQEPYEPQPSMDGIGA